MADRKTILGLGYRDLAALLAPRQTLVALTLPAAASLIFIVTFVPPSLVLPVISLTAIAAAATLSLIAWARGAGAGGAAITLWDIAGASVLIGCAAAMLSKPENVLHLFGQNLVP
ncbi:MAG: hypothetical protein WD073_08140 [Xanthobacteraceae bacterium]